MGKEEIRDEIEKEKYLFSLKQEGHSSSRKDLMISFNIIISILMFLLGMFVAGKNDMLRPVLAMVVVLAFLVGIFLYGKKKFSNAKEKHEEEITTSYNKLI